MTFIENIKALFSEPFESISTNELENLLASKNIQLIDVRTPEEFKQSHISKARNVPLSQINSFVAPKDKKVYVICQSGMRSKKAAHHLTKKGYQVINVRGGMSQWQGKVIGGQK
ncbi:rhodanese-like domain-containing protein [Streptococcus sp. CSL10205-OR2]|uniref:rhodanese-like domain-containing protein n=1 Tax=Streptococcus sp. CSL10205-OR2 TaxID=2980558 RepID=UPI0021D81D2F|nr:rhodanese-like domain-containing protein [Streptococcus sp. CSL10205-OR2]MCU9533764.1 rhodanese-like domain-containing protein [Streptococcus sp. CSL10205-OR2]